MVAGHRIEDCAVNDLLDRVVLVIAHNADFDRRFPERRLAAFTSKHWACSRSDIDWKAEGIRSSALEFVAYSLGFFHDGIGLRAIVGPPSMCCLNRSPVSAAGITDTPGESEIADMAVMGEGHRHRGEGRAEDPRLRLEPRRVRATEVLVSRRVGRR
jgi:hypothetical protein